MSSRLPCPVVPSLDVRDCQFDSVVVVTDSTAKLTGDLECLRAPLEKYATIDSAFEKDVVVMEVPFLPGKRLIFSPTGPLNRDCDDVRRFADAAENGIKRAVSAGSRSPLLVRPIDDSFPEAGKVTTLGALQALYVPLEIREDPNIPGRRFKVDKLGVWCNDERKLLNALNILKAIEMGRSVTRDIGGSDPERMAPPHVAEYVEDVFAGTCIKVIVVSDLATLTREYPLLAAVNRAAHLVERHQARLIFLEYTGEGTIDKTLLFVGKGICYDTGGADIKAGGHMAGMHRDKCGAATVAGIFQTLSVLKPKGLKAVAAMCMVRNSVGSQCYVADEIITSRAKVRVRVGNTDAEGRMVMSDLLCFMKEQALKEVNPHIFTIATLTGHAIRAMGPHYSIIMDNGPARREKTSQNMQESGDRLGDPFEISNIRREDYEFHKGKSEYEDVLQCNNSPSTMTDRGHQSPSAFMIMASGMDKHGIDSKHPIPYSHLDIAGSSGPFPGVPTGCPIPAIINYYVLPRL
ncbi:putative aminopeptidase W07G4.4 isoform X2 [Lineus longissimus]|uniref:putative aminopeptidase W07G4.4 isoform X2 n=1 Tax=Lineus longissimus TaxID=88925 RepID=UPI00315CF67F